MFAVLSMRMLVDVESGPRRLVHVHQCHPEAPDAIREWSATPTLVARGTRRQGLAIKHLQLAPLHNVAYELPSCLRFEIVTDPWCPLTGCAGVEHGC